MSDVPLTSLRTLLPHFSALWRRHIGHFRGNPRLVHIDATPGSRSCRERCKRLRFGHMVLLGCPVHENVAPKHKGCVFIATLRPSNRTISDHGQLVRCYWPPVASTVSSVWITRHCIPNQQLPARGSAAWRGLVTGVPYVWPTSSQ